MKIAGIQKNSFVDYPGKISAVVFTPGCNMNCFYCHNRNIITHYNQDIIQPDYFLNFINNRKQFLDGVVISGGEPTLQKGLKDFIVRIKEMGFRVKLDTNGTNPEVIRELLEDKLLNYIAMDIKAPFERYEEIGGVAGFDDFIKKSIEIIINSDIFYEFRTTLVPQLKKEDILKITQMIKGSRKYVIQQYRIPDNLSNYNDERLEVKPYSDDYLIEIGNEIKHLFKRFEVRGLK